MPFSIIPTTEKLSAIAEILFGSRYHNDMIINTHSNKDIIDRRLDLLIKSSYWSSVQPKPITEQTQLAYQPTIEEERSLQSLSNYIAEQIESVCGGNKIDVIQSSLARKRGASKAANVLEKNQNQMERYLTALRCVSDDPYEQTPTFLNPLRKNSHSDDYQGINFGIATYSYSGIPYRLRLIASAVWQAAADEKAEWTNALADLSKEKALLTSKENFIDVLVECMRAYNQNNTLNPFNSPDAPSCDLGAAERLLLRGAPYNKCFIPSPLEDEDEQSKLLEIQHSIDHYIVDLLDLFCTEQDKTLIFRVLSNHILMDEPDTQSNEAYMAIFARFKTSLIQKSEGKILFDYLVKRLFGFPWLTQDKLPPNLIDSLFQLLQIRIDLFISIELEDSHGLMNSENKNILNRLLMIGRHALTDDIWIATYQDMEDARKFEQDRITLKALEELIDTEYCRCVLAPGLLDTNKTQQRLKYLLSQYKEQTTYFTADKINNIKEQIDQITEEKLKHEFAQEGIHDTRHIIHYTLKMLNNRLQRLEKKCSKITQESLNTLYQTSLATIWDHSKAKEEFILPIAPQGIRLSEERYQQFTEKQKTLLAWSLHLANLSVCFDSENNHINRERDMLRGIAAMFGRTLADSLSSQAENTSSAAETFGKKLNHFSEEDVEAVIWIACSIIRELDISVQKKQIAWSTLENVCKNNEVFSRHISLEFMMEELGTLLINHADIWQDLPKLFARLGLAEEKIDSVNWCQYARFFYQNKNQHGLTLFSLLSIMSALELGNLHIANKQSISLYCKLFLGDHVNFNLEEKARYQDIIVAGKFKCTVQGLAGYLQQITDLIKSNQEFRAAFAEGIISTMPRKHAEQLVRAVATFTKKPILCPRLSSSCPNEIAVTALTEQREIYHTLYLPKDYYEAIKNQVTILGIKLDNAHMIMPGDNFNYKTKLKEHKQEHTTVINRYIKPSDRSSNLASTLKTLDCGRYASPNNTANTNLKITGLFRTRTEKIETEKTPKQLRPG